VQWLRTRPLQIDISHVVQLCSEQCVILKRLSCDVVPVFFMSRDVHYTCPSLDISAITSLFYGELSKHIWQLLWFSYSWCTVSFTQFIAMLYQALSLLPVCLIAVTCEIKTKVNKTICHAITRETNRLLYSLTPEYIYLSFTVRRQQ